MIDTSTTPLADRLTDLAQQAQRGRVDGKLAAAVKIEMALMGDTPSMAPPTARLDGLKQNVAMVLFHLGNSGSRQQAAILGKAAQWARKHSL